MLRDYFSEFALIRERVRIEIEWFLILAAEPGITELPAIDEQTIRALRTIGDDFSLEDADAIKKIEQTTNHDVKAVEYFIKEKLSAFPALSDFVEFVHFACTSEDINNLSWGRLLHRYRLEHLLPACDALTGALGEIASSAAETPLLSRTHGQTASPSTMGKEFANVVHRLRRHRKTIEQDWPTLAHDFVTGLGLQFNTHTTQIEPHDCIAELFDALARFNVTLIDLARDVWGYISMGFLSQKPVAGEIGSSTMPHKVNPIDFENAEGNLGLANAMFDHLSRKLPISRWQRDLTDSTVLRNLGVGAGYTEIAFASLHKGLGKLGVNEIALAQDLDNAWEVLAEPIQTIMRRHKVPNAYEALKELTRGNTMDEASIKNFIASLDIPDADRKRLLALTPANYTGLAARLAMEAS